MSKDFDGEYLVLDPRTGVVHALTGDFALVWTAVQDGTWPKRVADARVWDVVDELVARGLLVDSYVVSRRTALKAGAAGGASIALMGLSSMVLPTAAMAASEPLPFASAAVRSTSNETDTFTIQAGASVKIALVGGGGGATNSGGPGGPGQVWLGSVTNGASAPVQLTFSLGGGGSGGSAGAGGVNGGSGGGSSYSGGGGGASTLYLASTGAVLAVAAGGGGDGPGEASGQGPSSSHIALGINGASVGGSGGGGGGGQATGGDLVHGGGGNSGYGGYAGSTGDTGVGYSTYGGDGTDTEGLTVAWTGVAPTGYTAPSSPGSSPGSGASPYSISGYQGGIYIEQVS